MGFKGIVFMEIVVIHIPLFGKLNYLYVTIDTSSGLHTATPMAREKTNHVIQHMLKCIVQNVFHIMSQHTMVQLIISKYLLYSVHNGTLNIFLEFLITLKDKPLWRQPIKILWLKSQKLEMESLAN